MARDLISSANVQDMNHNNTINVNNSENIETKRDNTMHPDAWRSNINNNITPMMVITKKTIIEPVQLINTKIFETNNNNTSDKLYIEENVNTHSLNKRRDLYIGNRA